MTRELPMLECPCPPTGTLDIVGKKWAVCVVTLLGRYGELRFGPIQRALSRVSPATLTSTLRSLQREGLVERTAVRDDARAKGAYRLTTQGKALYQALGPLTSWLRRT